MSKNLSAKYIKKIKEDLEKVEYRNKYHRIRNNTLL